MHTHTQIRNTNLKHRTGSEWGELIAKLPKNVRSACGRIVWWDFFADRRSIDADRHLDFYLGTIDEPKNIDDWVAGLVALGYTEASARWRLGVRCKTFQKPLSEVYTRRTGSSGQAHHNGNFRKLFGRGG